MAAVRRVLLGVAPQRLAAAVAASASSAPFPCPPLSAAGSLRSATDFCFLGPSPSANSAMRALVTTARLEQQVSNNSEVADNHNALILLRLSEYVRYLRTHDAAIFRIVACKNAIAVLEQQETPVRSGADARKMRGIGLKLAKKIDEIISTGKLSALAPERLEAIEELKKVSGMSQEEAEKFVDAGVTSLEQLKNNELQLSEHQKIGLRYIDELSLSLPAAEVKEIEGVLRKAAAQWDPDSTIHPVGPYSRGQSVTGKGDLEFLLAHPRYTNEEAEKYVGCANPMLISFTEQLTSDGLIVENVPPTKADTYHAIIKLSSSGIRRMVTLKGCTVEQFPLALLCMTKPHEFISKLRRHASGRGYKLEGYELFCEAEDDGEMDGKKAIMDEKTKDSGNRKTKQRVIVQSKEDIFVLLGLDMDRSLTNDGVITPGDTSR